MSKRCLVLSLKKLDLEHFQKRNQSARINAVSPKSRSAPNVHLMLKCGPTFGTCCVNFDVKQYSLFFYSGTLSKYLIKYP